MITTIEKKESEKQKELEKERELEIQTEAIARLYKNKKQFDNSRNTVR